MTISLSCIVASAALLLGAVDTLASFAPNVAKEKSLLKLYAPLANDIDGAHLLIKGQAQTYPIIKNAFLFLSKPRDYYEGMDACLSMGDGGYVFIAGSRGATELVELLNSNAPANAEVQGFDQYWVFNDIFCDLSHQIKVNASVGQIQGWRDQNAFRFLGIPYAEPPTGERRFAKPVSKAPFNTGVWDATEYGHICPQMPLLPNRHQRSKFLDILLSRLENTATENEDCLYLNVYTPSLKSTKQPGLPVIVFIHGGGYTSFSGSTVLFEPGHMVARGGVVVVTFNYRLGFLGWFENTDAWSRTSVPGNQAIHDIILALQWVKNNIASFGGDPNRVTVMGESVGAVSIRALLSAPSTWDLYQNVIVESDPITLPFKPAAMATQETNYFMEALGCEPNNLSCARAARTEEISKAQLPAFDRALADNRWTTFGLVYRPVIDGDLIAADFTELVKQGRHNTKANILWGTMRDEAGLYASPLWNDPVPCDNASMALQELFEKHRIPTIMDSGFFQLDPTQLDSFRATATRFSTEYFWLCPLRYLSRQASKHKPTFNFRFNRGRDIPLVNDPFCGTEADRVCHSLGLQPSLGSGDAVPGYVQNGDDALFARQVIDRFTSFAKTGNPNPQPGQVGFEASNPDVTSVKWEPYNSSSSSSSSSSSAYSPILELNLQSKMSYNAEFDVCDWMDRDFHYGFQVHDPAKYVSSADM
ncbi:hypothetical protein BGZ99_003586 [Dissophora globulifera]|uniref:Carboxylesterase type B domain-containing protein n=1 Tax=Dissophora globulifera TaxID=979702 RepID=A0A9P6RJW5_9FUNG|nr:hypothetical protein BGZ99_003586 [Dissophora globulifera]